jgi:DNA-binding CsgD family transcriptional regulator/tetratricopeptide (TPR) repeat protein
MSQDPVSAVGRVDTTFVGRAEELGLFNRTLDQMLGGRRQILMLSGEPGIGKSRCAEEFAHAAEDQGALVVWGRCYEEPGTPPYWPWVQILREFMDASSPSEVRYAMGQGVSDIAAIVPELADEDTAPASSAATFDPSQTRFRMFDAIARFFAKATQQVPLVAVVDDLHWADVPSLSLLEFLSHELQRCRLLIVGTYRENEVSRKSPLQHTLGGLGKDAGVVRVRLAGLAIPAIATLAQSLIGPDLPSAAIAAIHHQTDGNPLFVIELLKVLIDESRDAGVEPIAVRIPDGVREAIGRRLDRLSERGNEVLSTASVIGRVFGAAEVSAALGDDFAKVLEHIEAATQTGIIERCSDRQGEYRFTHALIRETLYDEIPRLDRLRLHGRVADALVAVRAGNVEPELSRIAHHYHEAAMLGHVEEAAEYAARAAEHASRMQAHEEALTHHDRVIDVLTLSGRHSDERVARAMFLKGRALIYLGAYGDAAQALLKAVHAIKSSGNAEFVVDAASQLVLISATGPQREIVPLLEKALTLLADDAHAARAKAMASLALALRSSGDYERIERLTDQAVELATRLDDPLATDLCLCLSLLALRGRPQTLERRLAIGELHAEVARRADSLYVRAHAGSFQMEHLLEQGRIDESAAIIEQMRQLSCNYAQKDYFAATIGIALTLLRGEWIGLEERIEALREFGSRTRREDAEGVYGAQMFALKRDLGQLGELEPLVRSLVEAPGYRAWVPGLIVVCTELGLMEHSRRLLDRFAQNDFAQLPRDDMFVACLTYCSEACVVLGDSARAATIYRLLLPYAEQTLNHPRAVCFGSAQLFLALLAHTVGDDVGAREHFERAVTRNREMRAWPWLARALYHYARFLLQTDCDLDHERGRRFLTEADQVAGRLRMAALSRDIDRVLRGATDDHAFPDGLTQREIDVLRLITIGRANKDISKALTISLNTVATHVRSILNKTGCANRTEAAAYAMRNELQLASAAEHPAHQPAQPAP